MSRFVIYTDMVLMPKSKVFSLKMSDILPYNDTNKLLWGVYVNRLREEKSGRGISAPAIEIKRIGKYYSSCMMENMGLFMAVGFMEVLFISGGWVPNQDLRSLSSFLYQYVVPAFLAYSCGKRFGDRMGGIVSAVAVTGLATAQGCGLLGALLLGPAAGWITGKADHWIKERIPTGFEMLSTNLETAVLGITGMALVHEILLPLLTAVLDGILTGAEWLMEFQLLPLLSLMIEPLKVLFLNNYINHGLLVPLAAEQLSRQTRSIFFLLETNPGPGLGILLACIFSKKIGKQAGGTYIVIQFLAGIHEVYFPFVMRYPKLFFAAIAGGMSGVFVFSALGAGLAGTPAPGSVILLTFMAGKEYWWQVLLGVAVSAFVSLTVGMVMLSLQQSASDSAAADQMTGHEMDAGIAVDTGDFAGRTKFVNRENTIDYAVSEKENDAADDLKGKDSKIHRLQTAAEKNNGKNDIEMPVKGQTEVKKVYQTEKQSDNEQKSAAAISPAETDTIGKSGAVETSYSNGAAETIYSDDAVETAHYDDAVGRIHSDMVFIQKNGILQAGSESVECSCGNKVEIHAVIKEEETSGSEAPVVPDAEDRFVDGDDRADRQQENQVKSVCMNQEIPRPSMIYFACDAGFGSSAMAAALMRKKMKKTGVTGITVKNCNVDSIPEDAELIFAMYGFEKRLRELAWQSGRIVEFCFVEDLVSAPEYDEFIERWKTVG